MALISINTEALKSGVKNPKLWIIIGLSVLLVGGAIWIWTKRERDHKYELSKKDVLITALNNKWIECINAPPDTFFKPIHISSGPSEIIKPKPERLFENIDSVPYKRETIPSRENLADECPKWYYNDTLKVDKFTVNWEAMGCIRSFRILNIGLDHNYMIVTKQHTIIQYDTIYKDKTSPLFRWGPYTGMTLNSFSYFPGIELGAQVVIKDQFTLSLGGLYMNNNIYGGIRLGILFKK